MNSIIFKKSRLLFAFFIFLTTFTICAPNAIKISPIACGHAEIITSAPAAKINSFHNCRNGSETLVNWTLGLLAIFSAPLELVASTKEQYNKISLNDRSYNYFFRDILSSCAHPPTL